MKAVCIHPSPAVLAEGPVWHDRQLWWVDIELGEIHALDPATRAHRPWKLPHRIGFAVPTVRGDFLLGSDQGIARFSAVDGSLNFVAHPESEITGNRFNDAKCDPSGRLWAGTMAVNEAPGQGSLYRIDPDLRITRALPHISISNGLAWSLDGRTLYYIDSPTRRVDAFDFDAATGHIAHRRTVIEISDGFPDGMSIDHQGNLWIAIWGGWCVACHDPNTGMRLAKIDVPVKDVTSCCFGPDDTLYITTASRDLPPAQKRRHPLAGGIFTAKPGIGGPPPPPFPR